MSVQQTVSLQEVVSRYANACMRSFGNSADCWTVLASFPEMSLGEWIFAARADYFDSRGFTRRCRLWVFPNETPLSVLTRAVKAARRYDVTLQLLCVYEPLDDTSRRMTVGNASVRVRECREEYPVVHLGTHGMGWFEKKETAT